MLFNFNAGSLKLFSEQTIQCARMALVWAIGDNHLPQKLKPMNIAR